MYHPKNSKYKKYLCNPEFIRAHLVVLWRVVLPEIGSHLDCFYVCESKNTSKIAKTFEITYLSFEKYRLPLTQLSIIIAIRQVLRMI